MVEILIPVGVMGGLGLVLATVLLVAAKKFYVYEDPRIGQVEDLLPGANCGGCGLAGCKAFAEALVANEPDISCPVCGADAMAEIAKVLGQNLGAAEPEVAHVMCEGLQSSAVFNGLYEGVKDCRAAHLVGQVDRVCSYGCIGLGTCLEACVFDAIEIFDGIAHIIPENCVACGKCIDVCPRDLIVMIPKGRRVFVPCKSFDSAKVTGKVCEIGCIGCKKCVKVCPSDAILFDDNLATIDQEKCTLCMECIVACPRDLIKVRDLANYIVVPQELKLGLDMLGKEIKEREAEEKAKAEAEKPAAEAGESAGGNAAEIAKIQQKLDDARQKAKDNPAFADKLPAIEAKLTEKIEALGGKVDGGQA